MLQHLARKKMKLLLQLMVCKEMYKITLQQECKEMEYMVCKEMASKESKLMLQL